MKSVPDELADWVEALVCEARRDLVFLWHIEQGRIGGAGNMIDESTVLMVIEALLERGCNVGFGDPDSLSWRIPPQLRGPSLQLAHAIVALRQAQPSEYEFLVFAVRDNFGARQHVA